MVLPADSITIQTRTQLSRWMLTRVASVASFLNLALPSLQGQLFDLPIAFCGTLSPTLTTAALLLLLIGASSEFPTELLRGVRTEIDRELLLPQIYFPVKGASKSRIPAPWSEACRMTCAVGGFADVRVTDEGYLIRLCPMIPEKKELYALRTYVPFRYLLDKESPLPR